MKFIFECSNRYLTSERSERVGYRFEHEKINFISPSNHVIFCLLFKPTNYDVFDDFPKISDHFPKVSEDLQNVHAEGRTYVSEHFPNFSENFQRYPKIAEDYQGTYEDVSTKYRFTLAHSALKQGKHVRKHSKSISSHVK